MTEQVLEEALQRAVAAREWTKVEVLSRDLDARRKARANVVELHVERARRDRSR